MSNFFSKDSKTEQPILKDANVNQPSLRPAKTSTATKTKKAPMPTTSASLENITDFNTKFNKFENQQLSRLSSEQLALQLDPPAATHLTGYKGVCNPIISSLIERGEALRNEMLKSANSPARPAELLKPTNPHSTSSSSLKIPFEHSYILPSSMATGGFEYDSFNEYIDADNDFSRLSDPIHDPDILSALIYNQYPEATGDSLQQTTSFRLDDEDRELKELLQPPSGILNKLKKQPLAPNG